MNGTALTGEAIRDLLARYCHAIDRFRPDEWVSLFVEDGEFIGPGRPALRGHEALRQFLDGRGSLPTMHLTANTVVRENDGTTALVESDFFVLHVEDSTPRISAVGWYEDVLALVAEEVRFVRRVVHRLH